MRTLKRFVAGVWLVILCNGFGAWAASNVACWGDAFTSGSDGTNWPSILASLNGVTAYNGGVPNDTSVQVADRGSDPTNSAYTGWTTIIWAGYNDFLLPGGWQANTIITNVNRIVAARSASRFLVLGLVNAEGDGVGTAHYQSITNLNAQLAQAFGTNFFDVRSYLVSQYNPNSAQDLTDFANDVPPTSLRIDGLFCNAAGHQVIASRLSSLLSSTVSPPPPPPPVSGIASNVACWGDSLTAGSGGTNWPSVLAGLTGRTVYNGGVPSQTSVQISDRGSDPTNSIYNGWTTILWEGYNDWKLPGSWQPNTVITNINRILAARAPSRFLVLSIVNAEGEGIGTADYQSITNVNAALASTYGTNYFDIRSYLVTQYNPNSSADLADFANDIPPTSLRVDGLHWNAAGQLVIASKLSTVLGSAAPPPSPPPPLSGNSHFVSPSGSDGAAGTIAAPWRTISYGVSQLSPGDTLYLRQGTYHESFIVGVNGVTLSGYPGESAVIDGQINIPTSSYWPLVYVQSDNVTLTNLSVINSWYVGVILSGLADRATHLTVNSNMENGILVSGNYDIVDNCSVQWNARSHQFYTFNISGRTTWAGGINVARCPGNATITNNTVWNTWGEGISTYESTNNLFRGNVSYDNQVCLYISDTTDDLIDGNILYCTQNNVVKTAMGSANQPSILLGDEKYNPPSARNTFINNLVMGGDLCFYNTLAANNYVVVENNTFVNAFGSVANVQVNGDGPGSTFINNIVEQDNALPCIYINYSDWAVHSNNLWSKAPSSAASGTGDVVANPLLAKTGGIGPGQLTGNWFRLTTGSPAVKAGASLANVVDDFFGAPRTSPPDIGACAVYVLNPPSHLRVIAVGP